MVQWITAAVFLLLLRQIPTALTKSAERIPKCCPRSGYELESNVFGEHSPGSALLNCMSIVPQEDLQNVTESQVPPFYGLKLNDSDVASRLPVCGEGSRLILHAVPLVEVVELPVSSSCVDLVNGSYQSVMCSGELSSSEVDPVDVYALRKCCPVSQIYDEEHRACHDMVAFQDVPVGPFWQDDPKDIQLLKSLLNDFNLNQNHIGEPFFYIGVPGCSSDEVLVSYRMKAHEFRVERNKIIPKSKFLERNLNVFTSQPNDPFCIDSVAPSTVTDSPHSQTDPRNIAWIVRVCRPKSICDSIPCVRKCCDYNEKVVKRNNETQCEPFLKDLVITFHNIEGDELPDEPERAHRPEYGILFRQDCERYILQEAQDPNDRHYFNAENGFLHMDGGIFDHNTYCSDYTEIGAEVVHSTFVCFVDDYSERRFIVYAIGLCISCVFLLATLIVYGFLPKLLNLHGKTLVSHVSSLLVAYAGLAYIQFGITVQPKFCYIVALCAYGSFLAAFSWLNVMCFDIWWTFGSVRQSRGMRKTRDTRRFVCYSMYAWGIPAILTTFVHLVDKYTLLHSDYLPNMGKRSCWFASENGLAHSLFFLLPMGLIFTMNVIFFVLTAIHCNRVKSEIHRMQANDDSKDSHKKRFFADKARLLMNLKLFSVMGISWILELLTTIFREPAELWWITDAFNVMQGLFVFLIFVFKRNVLTSIKQRFGWDTRGTRAAVTTLGVTTTAGGTTTTSLMGSQNQVCLDPYSSRYKMTKSCSSSTVLSGIHRQKSQLD